MEHRQWFLLYFEVPSFCRMCDIKFALQSKKFET